MPAQPHDSQARSNYIVNSKTNLKTVSQPLAVPHLFNDGDGGKRKFLYVMRVAAALQHVLGLVRFGAHVPCLCRYLQQKAGSARHHERRSGLLGDLQQNEIHTRLRGCITYL